MIDLHSHSHYSDGKLSPAQLLRYAADCGVKVLALTDHDTINGLAEAKFAAEELNIKLIAGIELTATWKKSVIHVIGLNIDTNYPRLLEAVQQHAELRENRAQLIGSRLATVGIKDAYQGAKLLADKGNIARPHFAQFLVTQGYAKDMQTAFKRYLVRGKIGYVSSDWLDLAAAIALINDSGGLAVLAHPLKYGFTLTKMQELVINFKHCGGIGLEVISGHQEIKHISYLASLCHAHDLLASVGSDFHGEGVTTIKMGTLAQLPEKCTPIWHNWFDEGNI